MAIKVIGEVCPPFLHLGHPLSSSMPAVLQELVEEKNESKVGSDTNRVTTSLLFAVKDSSEASDGDYRERKLNH